MNIAIGADHRGATTGNGLVSSLGEPWPWDTSYFEAGGSGWAAPGATWSKGGPAGMC